MSILQICSILQLYPVLRFLFSLFQVWEARAIEDRKRYDKEMEEWKANGGQEALDNAAKEAKATKRASKKAAAGGAAATTSRSKASKPKPASASADTTSPAKAGGTGGHFKSKEFIEDSDSSEGKGNISMKTFLTFLFCDTDCD